MTAPVAIAAKPRSLGIFFGLAFGISWAVWIPAALASHGLFPVILDTTLSGLLGAFGPFFAALITAAIFDGRAGFYQLWTRLITWRVGLRWYAFVLAWPALLALAKSGIAVLLGSQAPDFTRPPFVELYPLPPELTGMTPFIAWLPFVFVQQTLLGSSMGEEPGWRGYALPRLQARANPLTASLVLGLLWGLWHLPLWLSKDHPAGGSMLVWSLLGLVATTILFTWVFNHTRGSLLLALLFHTSIATTGLFLAAADAHPLIEVALAWALAALVIKTLPAEARAIARG